ncbi:hypothetical protein [Shewanella acanthi]|uniref:hypothetical protein n=1 Tax=Shewanella acanthi TaxID=2864212 RepID=UPI001C654B39|nr:hypothetical protein [Shewanella acanthi]QYJ79929.1 hypothetical protein K0H61_05805 [Shewanella acanthi]
MGLFIEENKYHGDILECGYHFLYDKDTSNYIFSNAPINIKVELVNQFSFFKLFIKMLLLRIKGQEHIYFNTIEKPKSAFLFLFSLILGYKVSCTCHNFDAFYDFGNFVKLKKRLYRFFFGKLILNNAKVYVLTSDVLSYVTSNISNGYSCDISLLNLSAMNENEFILPSINDNYSVVLGGIDYDRRDYDKLLDYIGSNPDVVVYILGNATTIDGPHFKKRIGKLGLLKNFVFFDYFIAQPEFIGYVSQAEYIIDISSGSAYGKYKSSSTSIIGTALNKTVLALTL